MNENYPIRYVSLPVLEYNGINPIENRKVYKVGGYVTLEAYLLENIERYNSDGSSSKLFKIKFKKEIIARAKQFDLEANGYYYLTPEVEKGNYVFQIFEDYNDALKNTDLLNEKIRIKEQAKARGYDAFNFDNYWNSKKISFENFQNIKMVKTLKK